MTLRESLEARKADLEQSITQGQQQLVQFDNQIGVLQEQRHALFLNLAASDGALRILKEELDKADDVSCDLPHAPSAVSNGAQHPGPNPKKVHRGARR